MVLSNLLQPKSGLAINRIRFSRARRWRCSVSSNDETEKQLQLKKATGTEEEEIESESTVRKYNETTSGIFPKAIHVGIEVRDSLRDFVDQLKEKILGPTQYENGHNGDVPNSSVDPKASPVTASCSPSDAEASERHESELFSESTPESDKRGGPSSEKPVNTSASDVIEKHNGSSSHQIDACSVPSADSGSNGDFMLAAGTSHASRENYSKEIVELRGIEIVEPRARQMVSNYLSSSIIENSDIHPMSGSEKSSLSPQTQGDESQALNKIAADGLVSTECEKRGHNGVVKPIDIVAKSGVALLGGSKSLTMLLDCFRDQNDDEPMRRTENVPTESQQTLSDILLSFERHSKSKHKQLDGSDELLSGGVIDELQHSHLGRPAFSKQQEHPPVDKNIRSEVGELDSPFYRTQETIGLEDPGKSIHKQSPKGSIQENSITLPYTNEPSWEGTGDSSDSEGLIDYIKEMPKELFVIKKKENIRYNQPNQSSTRSPISEEQPKANLQRCYKHVVTACDADSQSLNCNKPKSSSQTLISTRSTDQKKLKEASCVEKVSGHKVLVRFLRSDVKEDDIRLAFSNCGKILTIEIFDVDGPLLKSAYIYFEARGGIEEALAKTNPIVRNGKVILEAASSTENTRKKTLVPSLIGDPDVPAVLVKNPTRTVKIQELAPYISSYDIEEALAFCECSITGFFYGSSSSVAFVEFETENGKERALAEHSIIVLGKHLRILRIDAPRTTILRISYPESLGTRNIIAICRSMGQVDAFTCRNPGIMDAHFSTTEWPNMLTILNRLNGYEVGGHQLVAQPASVFPPDILSALWHEPEGKTYLRATIHNLLRKLRENIIEESGLAHLEDLYDNKILTR